MAEKKAKSDGRATPAGGESKAKGGTKAKAEAPPKVRLAGSAKSASSGTKTAAGRSKAASSAAKVSAHPPAEAGPKHAVGAKRSAHSRSKASAPAHVQAEVLESVTPPPPPESQREEVELPEGYHPLPDEPYMNARQLEYFRRKLLEWREALLRESQQTIDHLRSDGASRYVGDEVDRARDESEVALELRTRDRYRKLLPKIDAALRRIEDGSYGFCEETGEPIGLKRLEARPIATLSVEAQEIRERAQRGYRDDA